MVGLVVTDDRITPVCPSQRAQRRRCRRRLVSIPGVWVDDGGVEGVPTRGLVRDARLAAVPPLVRVAAPGVNPRALFAELRARVMAEVDYRQEAEAGGGLGGARVIFMTW